MKLSFPSGHAVSITLGSRGATMATAGSAFFAPTAPVIGDSFGAGDAFAAAAARAVGLGEPLEAAVTAAVAFASSWMGRRQPANSGRSRAAIRAAGGRVVATGGCFDLLHRGHIATLTAARALGDYLVVCITGDDSAQSVNGATATRPLLSAADRRCVLEALSMVDEVVIYDEMTPERALEQIRPDVWVNGDDRGTAEREREVLARWGGQVVVVPHLSAPSPIDQAHARFDLIDIRGQQRQELL